HKGLDVAAAVIVVDRDRDRVRAVVGVGVVARELTGRIHAGRAGGVAGYSAGDRIPAVTPVDVVRKRLDLLTERVGCVVEARITEVGRERDIAPFVDRVVGDDGCLECGIHIRVRYHKGLDVAA